MNKNKHLVVLDGPIDAVWVESMNSVLDDNKKLCLSSGEFINLGQNLALLFEIENTLCVSPATVSRCGVVYLD